jgi:lysophospholipase L1-like esterase
MHSLTLSLYRAVFTAAAVTTAAHSAYLAADDPLVLWTGRTLIPGDGTITFDWEGVAATLTVVNASYVYANITDSTYSGTRFSVWSQGAVTTGGQFLHILDFLATPGGPSNNLMARADGSSQLTLTLRNEVEPTFIGSDTGHNLTVNGFMTDGVFVASPSLPTRRIEIIGDSITAGMGARFTGPCNANNVQNAISGTYTDVICRALNASCNVQAWSGIGVLCYYGPNCDPQAEAAHNMPHTYMYTIAGARDSNASAYLWDFLRFTPDAVLINLGTNDASGNRADNTTFWGEWVPAYVSFVQSIAKRYNNAQLPFFLAMGPLSLTPAPYVQQVVAAVNAAGGNATYLELATPGLPLGCAGHPSPAMHAQMANLSIPVIQQVMGW